MLTGILILIIFLMLSGGIIKLYRDNESLKNSIKNFSPVRISVGKITTFTQKQEDVLAFNKEFLEATLAYIDHKFGIYNEKMHDKALGYPELQFVRGQCDALIDFRGKFNTLYKREKKNDN